MLPLLLAVMIAQTAPTPAVAPADRLIAAFPAEQRRELSQFRVDEHEVSQLIALNPAREAEIRQVAESHVACASPLLTRMSENGLRWVAERLGDAKTLRIAIFYESGDAAFLRELEDRHGRGEGASSADMARFQRIYAAYPLDEYYETVEASVGREDALAPELFACDHARDEAYQQLGLRFADGGGD